MNFRIEFAHPWLLLVFLAGAALTALLYFQLSKRYRKTRNRITSIVLHLIVYALAVLTLAGTLFIHAVPNEDNQIILLVDVSDTTDASSEVRNSFIEDVLAMGKYDDYQIGIVTFGFDQVLAVPMTRDIDSIMPQYLQADLPDVSATDAAAALKYTAELFEKPESAKIVLITDGKETDEKALSVIRSISAKGISVDVAFIPSTYEGADASFVGITLPDYHVSLGEECTISVTLNAKSEETMVVSLFDNGTPVDAQAVDTTYGTQTVSFRYSFSEYGLHELVFALLHDNDVVEENNLYVSYLYLEQFNHLLVIESAEGSSEQLLALLAESPENYQVTLKDISDEDLPVTLAELRNYDQIILNNIANADMPEGFSDILTQYVSEFGGGLFTIGGSDADGKAHAYNRSDMLNTTYQSLLPVQAINYTPPVAVIVIIDRSGSMEIDDEETGATKYDLALQGAASCLNALSERDYFGLMTLDSEYDTLLPLTPRTQEAKILAAITAASEEGTGGGTVFPGAIQRACQALRNVDVSKRHIIVVSDGQVPESQREEYESYIKYYHENDGITLSVVGIGIKPGSEEAEMMQVACDLGGGRIYPITDLKRTPREMREDLNVPEIKEVNMETFYPTVKNALSALLNGIDLSTVEDGKISSHMKVSLEGFYGVKVKPTADLVLVGEYEVPIYATWRFGKGSVGSFMCDLNGTWSSDFLNLSGSNDGSGRKFLLNAINSLMPMESIRTSDITAVITQDNYTNKISVYSDLKEGATIVGTIINLDNINLAPVSMNTATVAPEGSALSDLPMYVTSPLDASNNYSRCDFVIKASGTYLITLSEQLPDGTVLATYETFRSFSFSEEYDTASEIVDEDLLEGMNELAKYANGSVIEDLENPYEIFANFITEIIYTFDPRFLFMILAIILFLADIAVRKFKFKWPHELIRNFREKQSKKGGITK